MTCSTLHQFVVSVSSMPDPSSNLDKLM